MKLRTYWQHGESRVDPIVRRTGLMSCHPTRNHTRRRVAHPVITQDDEYDEGVHLPPFGIAAVSCGFNQEEIQKQRDAALAGFARDVLEISSAAPSDDSESDFLRARTCL
jgi:hypothetical protein